MTANEAIRASAYKMARGELERPAYSGQCLKLVRIIIEDALYGGEYKLYNDFLAKEHLGNPYAVHFEEAMVDYRVPAPVAGDIVFNGKLGEPYGHVGVLIEDGMVIENTKLSHRPNSIKVAPFVLLTPFDDYEVTSVVRMRFPP